MAAIQYLLNELRDCAALPPERAKALPPTQYRSEEIFERERRSIFAHAWVCPGRLADIPKSGDYLTCVINDQPIVVVRGQDGAVRAFSNVCLHRMSRLLEGSGHCRHIVCPYHSWTYDLTGRLIAAPHMDRSAGFDTAARRLPEIRCEAWQGWIYLTLDPDAESIAGQLAPLDAIVARYDMARYVPLGSCDFTWRANWKIAVENAYEGYHLPVLHRKTVGVGFPMTDTEFPVETWPSFSYHSFTKDETSKYGIAHSSNTRLEGRWRYTSVLPLIFPSHAFVLAPDMIFGLSAVPKGLAETHLRLHLALAPEVHATLDDAEAFARERMDFFVAVCEEDRRMVETIQENLGALLAKPGRLSWLERSTHDFTRYLARMLVHGGGERAG